MLETDRLSCSGEAVTIKIDSFHRLSYLNNTQDTVVWVFFNDSVLGTNLFVVVFFLYLINICGHQFSWT